MIYAEVSIGFDLIEEVEHVLSVGGFTMAPIPKEALFLAGKAFLRYRRKQGTKASPLPDFFIGAHATVANVTLLTRDKKRIKYYFPSVDLVSP
jgi:predicted nucleic acid-binding protein